MKRAKSVSPQSGNEIKVRTSEPNSATSSTRSENLRKDRSSTAAVSAVPASPVRRFATTATVELARTDLLNRVPKTFEDLIEKREALEKSARGIAETAGNTDALTRDQRQQIEGTVESLIDRLGEASSSSSAAEKERLLDAIRHDLQRIESINNGQDSGPVG